jgi:hypothetical protein
VHLGRERSEQSVFELKSDPDATSDSGDVHSASRKLLKVAREGAAAALFSASSPDESPRFAAALITTGVDNPA